MKGSYILFLKLIHENEIIVGGLGATHFPCGFYAYVGSALNSLESRISHHLKTKKRYHWHIDYLLGKATIYHIFQCESIDRQECMIARTLSNHLTFIPNFGASDCSCQSHLFIGKTSVKPVITKLLHRINIAPKSYAGYTIEQ